MDNIDDAVVLKLAHSYDLKTLYQIKEKLINDGSDLDLINKAISKKLEMEHKERIDKENENKEFKKAAKKAAFAGLLSGLFSGSSKNKNTDKTLSDWEIQELNNNNYEDLNFEEEDLDEDDFYSDDLD